MQTGNFTRALGLKESIAMTVGTVVGVGLFTCGSAQIGFMGTRVIGMTLLALLISIWPSMLYGEMAAAMPGAGGTYNFARKGINPSIAAPARYLYSMAQDKAIVYIASVSLIALGICYIIGCMSYIGLRKKFKDMIRPYKAPRGVFGACLTIVLYIFMLCFADKSALITTSVISLVCVAFWFFFSRKKAVSLPEELYSTIAMEEPSAEEKRSMDRQYHIWMAIAVVLCLLAIALFTFGILTGKGII